MLRIFLICLLIAVSLTSAIGIQHTLERPDMMRFDPQKMGKLESAMWRSYRSDQLHLWLESDSKPGTLRLIWNQGT